MGDGVVVNKFCCSVCGRGLVTVLVLLLVASCKQRSADEFVTVKDPVIALTHLRLIDGRGAGVQDELRV